jgi:hypothetical protein
LEIFMSTLKTNKIQTATDSDLTLDTASTSKRIIIPTTTGDDVDLDALSGRLVIGNVAGAHLAIDENEIEAKSDTTTATTLSLQRDGGEVHVFGAGSGLSADGVMGIGTDDPKVPLDIYEMGGLVIGYTALDNGGATGNARIEVGTSYAVPNSNWRITFQVPKSGKVEIQLSVYARSTATDYLYLGLSNSDTYSTIGSEHENLVWESDEDDDSVITPSWLLTGLSPGAFLTYYIGAKALNGYATSGIALDYGGTNANYRQHAIIRAVAVPNTIHTD